MCIKDLKKRWNSLITPTQERVVGCGSTCIQIIYLMCWDGKTIPNQQKCDLASQNWSSSLIRKIIWLYWVQRTIWKQKFGLTLWGLQKWSTHILNPLWYKTHIRTWQDIEDLRRQIKKWLPCIVLALISVEKSKYAKNKYIKWVPRNGMHYIVVYHIDHTHIYFRDPLVSISSQMLIEEFNSRRQLENKRVNDYRAKRFKRLWLLKKGSVVYIQKAD